MFIGGLALFVLPVAFANAPDDKFAKMDGNGDGKISRAEHSAGAQQMFAEMDANSDGIVTAAEMDAKKSMKPDAAGRTEMSAKEKIKAIDQNADGQLTAAEHAAGSETMFGKMDTNGDGALSKEELKAGHKGGMKH